MGNKCCEKDHLRGIVFFECSCKCHTPTVDSSVEERIRGLSSLWKDADGIWNRTPQYEEVASFLRQNRQSLITRIKGEVEKELEDWFYRHATKEPDDTFSLILHENHDWEKAKEDLLNRIDKIV